MCLSSALPVFLARERRGPGEGADENGKENISAQADF